MLTYRAACTLTLIHKFHNTKVGSFTSTITGTYYIMTINLQIRFTYTHTYLQHILILESNFHVSVTIFVEIILGYHGLMDTKIILDNQYL